MTDTVAKTPSVFHLGTEVEHYIICGVYFQVSVCIQLPYLSLIQVIQVIFQHFQHQKSEVVQMSFREAPPLITMTSSNGL